MAEINQAKLDKLVKAGKSQPECARELGVTAGQLGMLKYGKALVACGKLAKAPKTEASFKKLRASGMRFEYIAAATGASVAEVKAVVGNTSIAKGRKSGGGSTAKRSGTASKRSGTASKRSSAKRSSAKRAPAGRARTRAARAAKAGNPS